MSNGDDHICVNVENTTLSQLALSKFVLPRISQYHTLYIRDLLRSVGSLIRRFTPDCHSSSKGVSSAEWMVTSNMCFATCTAAREATLGAFQA